MKILLLYPYFPDPPHGGTALRNYNLAAQLATRHEISVVAFGDPERVAATALAGRCRRVEVVLPPRRSTLRRVLRLAQPVPDLADRLASAELTAKLAGVLAAERYDVLHVGGLEMVPHWLAATRDWEAVDGGRRSVARHDTHRSTGRRPPSTASRPAVVLDEHNAEYVLQARAFRSALVARRLAAALYSGLQALKLRRYEAMALRRADGVVAVSESDRAALERIAPLRTIAVVPNGVDTDAYTPSLEQSAERLPSSTTVIGGSGSSGRLSRPFTAADEGLSLSPEGNAGEAAGAPHVVFTGTMSFRPNVEGVEWFCRRIWPLIRAKAPSARFSVVGREPTAAVRALAGMGGVEVIGAVPDDRPWIGRATIYVAPLLVGGGVRLKILQAMAMAVPIVSTTLGYEGIAATPGEHLLTADSPEDFAVSVLHLLDNASLRARLARQGRALAVEQYDWRRLVPKLEELYQDV